MSDEDYVYIEASGEWLPVSQLAFQMADIERVKVRDLKLLDIGAGTNEIRRMLIGRELIGVAG